MSDFENPNEGSKGADLPSESSSNDPQPAHGQSDFAHASQSWDAPEKTHTTAPFPADESSIPNQTGKAGAGSPKRVREVLGNAQEILQRNYRVASDSTDDLVQENPWKAITLAALVGIILGMLINR
jgi:hypothetical protein